MTTTQRETKYCTEIRETLRAIGHATNAEIHTAVRMRYPDVSATTIHRATARMAERGEIGIAPTAKDGSMRYDAATEQHDHFMCTRCNRLVDAHFRDVVAPILAERIEGCSISGPLVVSGVCKHCMETN